VSNLNPWLLLVSKWVVDNCSYYKLVLALLAGLAGLASLVVLTSLAKAR
jgi:hypothetical protein